MSREDIERTGLMGGMDTFVVRIWVPPSEESGARSLRGILEHIRSGESREFRDALELVERVRELLSRPGEGERRITLRQEMTEMESPREGGGT